MPVFFRILFLVLFLISSVCTSAKDDILLQRICKYNKIEQSKVIVDSNLISYNLRFINKNKNYQSNIQIIQSRIIPVYNYSFFWLLIALFFFSMMRYLSGTSYRYLLASFFSMKDRSLSQNSFLKNLLVGCSFILLLSYSLFQVLWRFSKYEYSNYIFLKIIFSCVVILFYKYVLFQLVTYVFNFRSKISEVRFIIFDFMYIFVFISLPLLFFSTLLNSNLAKSILVGILAIFILLILFLYYKVFNLNSYLLTRNVFKGIIYFYVVEIIPILLLLKYLKLL
jgi:hypothetical protein